MFKHYLTLREVALFLGLSEKRVYQLDEVLKPVFELRGATMKTRRYALEMVEAYRRAMPTCACGCGKALPAKVGAGRRSKFVKGHSE